MSLWYAMRMTNSETHTVYAADFSSKVVATLTIEGSEEFVTEFVGDYNDNIDAAFILYTDRRLLEFNQKG